VHGPTKTRTATSFLTPLRGHLPLLLDLSRLLFDRQSL
jgi:hypothetical protein